MPSIRVEVEFERGASRRRFVLPADQPVSRLLRVIVMKLELPSEQENGGRLRYQLRSRDTGGNLPGEKTLGESGVSDGAVLEIVANSDRASAKEPCKTAQRTAKRTPANRKAPAQTTETPRKTRKAPPDASDQRRSLYEEARRLVAKAQALLPLKCGEDDMHLQREDLVICCPSCGTPHHQKCWKNNGNRCADQRCPGKGPQDGAELWEVVDDIDDALLEYIMLSDEVYLEDEEFFDKLCEVQSDISDVSVAFMEAELEE